MYILLHQWMDFNYVLKLFHMKCYPFGHIIFAFFSLCLSLWLKDECLINYLTGFYFGIPVIL